MKRRFAVVFALLAVLWGCPRAPQPPPVTPKADLILLSPRDYPRFSDDADLDSLGAAIRQSLAYYRKVPADRTFGFGADRYTAAHLIASLTTFTDFLAARPGPEDVNAFITARYRVYRSAGEPETGRVLFTGYFEPLLEGSRERTAEFQYPIYGRPADLLTIDLTPFSQELAGKKIIGRFDGRTLVPYLDRAEIENSGFFAGKAPPLAWVQDRVDIFFLQIQGSGRILLPDGSFFHLLYDTTNGRPYRSIGKYLIDKGKVPREEMSMQRIRAYLVENPEEMDTVFNQNPSYVFFRKGSEGPLGALGRPLTPGRSIAIDRRIFPDGALGFVRCQKPQVDEAGNIVSWAPFSRFVLAQDTGGAIRGPGRVDFFWGNGPYAETAAGHLKHPGELYFLVLSP